MAMRDLIPWGREQNSAPALWRDDDFGAVSSFRRQMDRLFDDFFRAPSLLGSGTTGWPSVEVNETDREVKVTAEMPGMGEKDVDLSLDNGMLTIRGEKKAEQNERGYSERWYGRFERRIPVPASIDEEHCRADFRDGLLTVTLPKREGEEHRKRIPINAETRH